MAIPSPRIQNVPVAVHAAPSSRGDKTPFKPSPGFDGPPPTAVDSLTEISETLTSIQNGFTALTGSNGFFSWFQPTQRKSSQKVHIGSRSARNRVFDRTDLVRQIVNLLEGKRSNAIGSGRQGDLTVLTVSNDLSAVFQRAVCERVNSIPREFLHQQTKMTALMTCDVHFKDKSASGDAGAFKDATNNGVFQNVTSLWLQQLNKETVDT